MRAPFIGGVLLALGLAAPAAAPQTPEPQPFERLIYNDYLVRSAVTDCTVPSAVAGLAHRYRFAAGIEYPRSECARIAGEQGTDKDLLNFRGLTVGDALKKLAAMDPRYRWVESDGVLVVRPHEAWGDPTNMLNYQTESFVLEDATIGSALAAVVAAITGQPKDSSVFTERTDDAARRFDVKTRVTSAGETLDAIVRAHGASYWTVREGTPNRDGQAGRIIFFSTFDGYRIGTGTPPLK